MDWLQYMLRNLHQVCEMWPRLHMTIECCIMLGRIIMDETIPHGYRVTLNVECITMKGQFPSL